MAEGLGDVEGAKNATSVYGPGVAPWRRCWSAILGGSCATWVGLGCDGVVGGCGDYWGFVGGMMELSAGEVKD